MSDPEISSIDFCREFKPYIYDFSLEDFNLSCNQAEQQIKDIYDLNEERNLNTIEMIEEMKVIREDKNQASYEQSTESNCNLSTNEYIPQEEEVLIEEKKVKEVKKSSSKGKKIKIQDSSIFSDEEINLGQSITIEGKSKKISKSKRNRNSGETSYLKTIISYFVKYLLVPPSEQSYSRLEQFFSDHKHSRLPTLKSYVFQYVDEKISGKSNGRSKIDSFEKFKKIFFITNKDREKSKTTKEILMSFLIEFFEIGNFNQAVREYSKSEPDTINFLIGNRDIISKKLLGYIKVCDFKRIDRFFVDDVN